MVNILRLSSEIERMEPALEEAMRFHPAAWPEGLRLRTSVCGFASNTLAKCVREKMALDPRLKIGVPVDDPSLLPSRMRRHVVFGVDNATVDSTWGQFMALVGLDANLAAHSEELRALYPARSVAVIPKGTER